jgi:hypothetical protein
VDGLASKDITRVIYLVFLASDIVHLIVSGGQPTELNVERLLAMVPLPMDWAEQRRGLSCEH